MQNSNRKCSLLTAILVFSVILLILALFGRSVQGQGPRPAPLKQAVSQGTLSGPFTIDAGYYHTLVPESAGHNYRFLVLSQVEQP